MGKNVEPKRRRTKPATPDAYQYERAVRLGVSQRAIGNALKRLGISYKKNTQASESGRNRTAHFSNTTRSRETT